MDLERTTEALKESRVRAQMMRDGVDPTQRPPEVEVREGEDARKIVDNVLPGVTDPEWLEWERKALDPTKDL